MRFQSCFPGGALSWGVKSQARGRNAAVGLYITLHALGPDRCQPGELSYGLLPHIHDRRSCGVPARSSIIPCPAFAEVEESEIASLRPTVNPNCPKPRWRNPLPFLWSRPFLLGYFRSRRQDLFLAS